MLCGGWNKINQDGGGEAKEIVNEIKLLDKNIFKSRMFS